MAPMGAAGTAAGAGARRERPPSITSSARGLVASRRIRPGALQLRQMRVHRRRRGEPDRLADLTHGRRIPVGIHVGVHELENLLLPLGQIHRRPPGVERVFGSQCARRVGRSQGTAGRMDREGETPQERSRPVRAGKAATRMGSRVSIRDARPAAPERATGRAFAAYGAVIGWLSPRWLYCTLHVMVR